MTTPVTSLRNVNVEKPIRDEQVNEVAAVIRNLIVQSFSYWQSDGVVDNHGGFGVAMRIVRTADGVSVSDFLDDVNALFDLVHEHGHQSRRFLNRALCKLRAALRTGKNTGNLTEDEFENVVTDADMDSSDPQLGEYPHRGGVVVKSKDGKYVVYAAISGFSGRQDHINATFLGYMALDKLATMDEAAAHKAEPSSTADTVVSGG